MDRMDEIKGKGCPRLRAKEPLNKRPFSERMLRAKARAPLNMTGRGRGSCLRRKDEARAPIRGAPTPGKGCEVP